MVCKSQTSTAILLIVAFLFAAAVASSETSEAIEQQGSNTEFSAAEADFTESTLLDTMKTSSTHHSVVRAALGRGNRSCITRFRFAHKTTVEGASMDGKISHKNIEADAEYTVRVTPISKTRYGTQYKLEGRRLMGHRSSFRRCAIFVDQAADGSIPTRSFTRRKGACAPFMINLLLKAVEALSPVIRHKAGLSEFTTVEDDALFSSPHRKRMAYSIKKLPNGDTAVSSQGITLLKLPPTVTGVKHKKQFNDMIKTHAHQVHHISIDGHLKKGRVHAKLRVGDLNKKPPPSWKGKFEDVPNNLFSEARPKVSLHKVNAKIEAKLLKNTCTQVEMAVLQTATPAAFIQQQLKAGMDEGKSYLEETPNPLQPIADLPAAKRNAAVKNMASKLPGMSQTEANKQATLMMELEPIRNEVMAQIKDGTLSGNDIAHEFLNALGTSMTDSSKIGDIADSLVSVAATTTLPVNTREQAILALMNDECHDHKPVIAAIDKLLAKNGHDEEVSEFALQLQHGLMHNRVACEPNAHLHKTIYEDHQTQAARTEDLLLQKASAGEYSQARALMSALGNSRFPRHASAINKVLAMHHLPAHMHDGAVEVLSLLEEAKGTDPAAIAKLVQEHQKKAKKGKGKKSCEPTLYKNVKKHPLPKSGDIQAIASSTTKVTLSGAKWVGAIKFKAFSFKRTLASITASKEGFGICEDSKPASLVFKLLKHTVYKRKFGKKHKAFVGAGKKAKTGKTFKNKHVDKGGVCSTKAKALKCLNGTKLWKKTFLKVGIKFTVGPVPMKVAVHVGGKWGVQYGVGMLKAKCAQSTALAYQAKEWGDQYGKQVFPKPKGKDGKGKKGKGKKCDHSFNGFLVQVEPFMEADLTLIAEVDLYVVKGGVSAQIQLVKLALPITLDSCVLGDCKNQCINGALETAAGGGTIKAFVKVKFVSKKQFTIFNWKGGSWVFPEYKGKYTGYCTGLQPPKYVFKGCYKDTGAGALVVGQRTPGRALETYEGNNMNADGCHVKCNNAGTTSSEVASETMLASSGTGQQWNWRRRRRRRRTVKKTGMLSFKLFGLQDNGQCFCGNKQHTANNNAYKTNTCTCKEDGADGGNYGAANNCVYKVTARFGFKGCYSDKNTGVTAGQRTGGRDLQYYVGNKLNKFSCYKACHKKSFKYFGLQYSGQCFCGNTQHINQKTSGCSCDVNGSAGGNYGANMNCVYDVAPWLVHNK